MKLLKDLVRPNILSIERADSENLSMSVEVKLDANESPYNRPFNRYPEPTEANLKVALAKVMKVPHTNIFLGNGIEEIVDIILRCFAEPSKDNVVGIEPTSDIYRRYAEVNGVEYRKCFLNEKMQLSASEVLNMCDSHTKIVWLCTPNNPTGNNLKREEIEVILDEFQGIVVIDESFAEYSNAPFFRYDTVKHPNLIVLSSMSHAWASAAIRLGMAFAQEDIMNILHLLKAKYGINRLTRERAIEMLQDPYEIDTWVKTTVSERSRMALAIQMLPICETVYPSDANFILVKLKKSQSVYEYLLRNGIAVCNVSRKELCDNCLRITIGTRGENDRLLAALRQII